MTETQAKHHTQSIPHTDTEARRQAEAQSTSTPAVRIRRLVKTFGDYTAVDHIDLDIRRGEVFGVLGPNGAGKTTMINMLATLLHIDEGHAEIFGIDVTREPHKIRQLIGVTGQYASVDEKLTGGREPAAHRSTPGNGQVRGTVDRGRTPRRIRTRLRC